MKTASGRKIDNGGNRIVPYAAYNIRMNSIVILGFMLSLFSLVATETFFPGRRLPISAVNDEKSFLIEQLSNFIDQQARRRFHQQFQQHHAGKQHGPIPQEINGPGFSFVLPGNSPNGFLNENEAIPFAVSPNDPRYYQSTPKEEYVPEDDTSKEDEVAEEFRNLSYGNKFRANEISKEAKNKILIPPPMHVNPQAGKMSEKQQTHIRQQEQQHNDVLQKPLSTEYDSTFSLYIVALIAGLSCAISMGMVAIGIMYYTLYKKSKSAADVEYPAYGITGPNKETSPTAIGDKKLAQSAQMFHYQHQKQQIIAMENRNGSDINGQQAGSDVETDDDNENDYTVYECPGLASTGEMEVNNPIFCDASTTPAASKGTPKADKNIIKSNQK